MVVRRGEGERWRWMVCGVSVRERRGREGRLREKGIESDKMTRKITVEKHPGSIGSKLMVILILKLSSYLSHHVICLYEIGRTCDL